MRSAHCFSPGDGRAARTDFWEPPVACAYGPGPTLGGQDMAEPERGPREIDTGERVGALGSAVVDAARHMAAGEHETQHGAEQRVELGQVKALIDGWPEGPKKIRRACAPGRSRGSRTVHSG